MAKKLAKKRASVKRAIAKTIKKQQAKRAAARPVKHEIVLHVDTAPVRPTVSDLAEPIRDGKSLTIPKTWMSEHQITFMLQRTPKEQVYNRPGKSGQKFDYVTGSYITKALNYAFGWNWDFEIIEHGKEQDHVWVLGKLTVRDPSGSKSITKTQFGRSEVKYLTETVNGKKVRSEKFVDYGNDLKAASTDALKKCASMLGFASDIYGKTEYKKESGNDPLPPPQDPSAQAEGYEEPSIAPGAPTPKPMDVCQWLGKGGCGVTLSASEAAYSRKLYRRPLCKNHFPK